MRWKTISPACARPWRKWRRSLDVGLDRSSLVLTVEALDFRLGETGRSFATCPLYRAAREPCLSRQNPGKRL